MDMISELVWSTVVLGGECPPHTHPLLGCPGGSTASCSLWRREHWLVMPGLMFPTAMNIITAGVGALGAAITCCSAEGQLGGVATPPCSSCSGPSQPQHIPLGGAYETDTQQGLVYTLTKECKTPLECGVCRYGELPCGYPSGCGPMPPSQTQ